MPRELSWEVAPIARGKTTADEVEERLILAIARGKKAPGERITEAEVAAAFNVSRVPAREAMQKLQIRGILVGGPDQRGLRIADFGERRIAELFELRLAIETIFFRHVMRPGGDRRPLVRDLKEILKTMASLSGSDDLVALGSIDLEFHRTVARHSGNELAVEIWEGLAQHFMIVFCRDWANAADRTGEVHLHARLIDFIEHGDPAQIAEALINHFATPLARTKSGAA
ncbi:MAG: GntR family transcriptional regulator [Rhizobiaceae bacterium]|nr:GntR family transcriptional regulator [Rhizobiaceae bacterium]